MHRPYKQINYNTYHIYKQSTKKRINLLRNQLQTLHFSKQINYKTHTFRNLETHPLQRAPFRMQICSFCHIKHQSALLTQNYFNVKEKLIAL